VEFVLRIFISEIYYCNTGQEISTSRTLWASHMKPFFESEWYLNVGSGRHTTSMTLQSNEILKTYHEDLMERIKALEKGKSKIV
jgi:hypothetical protein